MSHAATNGRDLARIGAESAESAFTLLVDRNIEMGELVVSAAPPAGPATPSEWECGVMFELDSQMATSGVLQAGGFTLLMAVNLMLFSLVHNPCSTTIYTIWKETRSAKWTAISGLLPVAMGIVVDRATLAISSRFSGGTGSSNQSGS